MIISIFSNLNIIFIFSPTLHIELYQNILKNFGQNDCTIELYYYFGHSHIVKLNLLERSRIIFIQFRLRERSFSSKIISRKNVYVIENWMQPAKIVFIFSVQASFSFNFNHVHVLIMIMNDELWRTKMNIHILHIWMAKIV